MKILAAATLLVSLSSCATDTETSTTSQDILGPDATLTETWTPGKMVANDIWPNPGTVTTTQILYRKAPQYCVSNDDICNATHGTLVNGYFAFVVWNHTTLGHVYFLPENATGSDFKNFVNQTFATRTNAYADRTNGSTGSPGGGGGGTRPPPRPNVYPVTPAIAAAAKNAAAQIDAADATFVAASMM